MYGSIWPPSLHTEPESKTFFLQLHPDKHSMVAFTPSSLLSVRKGIKKAEIGPTYRMVRSAFSQPCCGWFLGRTVLFETWSRPAAATNAMPARGRLRGTDKDQRQMPLFVQGLQTRLSVALVDGWRKRTCVRRGEGLGVGRDVRERPRNAKRPELQIQVK